MAEALILECTGVTSMPEIRWVPLPACRQPGA